MTYDCHLYTTAGGRSVNEDDANYRFDGESGMMVVADGLGGHGNGEAASRSCVDILMRRFPSFSPICDFAAANKQVLELNGPLTTLAAVYIRHNQFQSATVGDTRVYLFRKGNIIFQSPDDSVSQMRVHLGKLKAEQIRTSPDRNRLLAAVGAKKQLKPFLTKKMKLYKDDAVLLCSDGLWELVLETEMKEDLAQSISAEDWCRRLALRLESRLQRDSDNATFLCCLVK